VDKVTVFQKVLAVETAIAEYIDLQGGNRKLGAAKGKVTKLANELAFEIGVIAARERILKFLKQIEIHSERLDLLKKRFTPRTFYIEQERIFGWWDINDQFQAEPLPIYSETNWDNSNAYIVAPCAGEWNSRGFDVAQPLPVKFHSGGLEVSFPVKQSLFWLEHGYALPCELQWRRGEWPEGGTCLWVDRSIIQFGFWQAWKWWDTAKWWYLDKRPELFADMDWWGEPPAPQRFEPDDPYAAVLGGMGNE
jgi:hypothetical protein